MFPILEDNDKLGKWALFLVRNRTFSFPLYIQSRVQLGHLMLVMITRPDTYHCF